MVVLLLHKTIFLLSFHVFKVENIFAIMAVLLLTMSYVFVFYFLSHHKKSVYCLTTLLCQNINAHYLKEL